MEERSNLSMNQFNIYNLSFEKKNITVFGALFVEIDKILDKYYSYYTIRLHRRKVNLHSSFFSS